MVLRSRVVIQKLLNHQSLGGFTTLRGIEDLQIACKINSLASLDPGRLYQFRSMLGRAEIQQQTVRRARGTFGDSYFESRNIDFWRLDSLRKPSECFLEVIEPLKQRAY